MKNFIVFVVGISLFGCTSALKKKCQETNWFEHGKSVAMQGKRLNEDNFAAECEKQKVHANSGEIDLGFKAGMAKYCEIDVVFQTGRSGEFFNPDLCDPALTKVLKKRHREGVGLFCEPANGYQVGASGRVYNKICPPELEARFMKDYHKGRKIYLIRYIQGKENELLQMDQQIISSESEIQRLHREVLSLPSSQIVTRERVYDPNLKAFREEVKTSEDESVRQRRSDLQYRISGEQRKIDSIRTNQTKIREEIAKLGAERDSL